MELQIKVDNEKLQEYVNEAVSNIKKEFVDRDALTKAIKNIKDDIFNKSEYIIDNNGVAHRAIHPLDVIDIINERLQEVEE